MLQEFTRTTPQLIRTQISSSFLAISTWNFSISRIRAFSVWSPGGLSYAYIVWYSATDSKGHLERFLPLCGPLPPLRYCALPVLATLAPPNSNFSSAQQGCHVLLGFSLQHHSLKSISRQQTKVIIGFTVCVILVFFDLKFQKLSLVVM